MQTTTFAALSAAAYLFSAPALAQDINLYSASRSMECEVGVDDANEFDGDDASFSGFGRWDVSTNASLSSDFGDLDITLTQDSNVAASPFPLSGSLSMVGESNLNDGVNGTVGGRNTYSVNFTVSGSVDAIMAWELEHVVTNGTDDTYHNGSYKVTLERFSRSANDPGDFWVLASDNLGSQYQDFDQDSKVLCFGNSYQLTIELSVEMVWNTQVDTSVDFNVVLYPSNDEPENALELTTWWAPLHTSFATTSQEPAGGFPYNDVWFVYDPSNPDMATLSTCGVANFDTVIAVYEGLDTPVTSDRLVSYDDDSFGCGGNTSHLEFTPDCNKKYLVRVGAYGENERGSGRLLAPICLDCDPCAPESAADFNGDGKTNGEDMGMMLANWGNSGTGDVDGNGVVNGGDLGLLIADWNN